MGNSTKNHHAGRDLSAQFDTMMMQERMQGRGVQRAVPAFGKYRIKLLSGILGGAGVAGGAWAALSMWSGSMGLWGSLAFSLGLIATPVWVPFAGGMAGLNATGGVIYGFVSLACHRGRQRMLTGIVDFNKLLLHEGEFPATD